jgi:hypothetical protein
MDNAKRGQPRAMRHIIFSRRVCHASKHVRKSRDCNESVEIFHDLAGVALQYV